VVRLETRPANLEGNGEVSMRDLVKNALRMRPDRIIVGEVRGAETLDMLQAMNTGHEGSLTTIHANSPRDALSRLETLVMTGGVELPHRAIREQIASAFDLLIQIQRLVDGSRRVTHVTEVLGMEADVVTMQDIFVASPPTEEEGYSGGHRLLSPLRATGLKPHFLEKLAANNVVLPPTFFSGDDPDQLRASFAAVGFGVSIGMFNAGIATIIPIFVGVFILIGTLYVARGFATLELIRLDWAGRPPITRAGFARSLENVQSS